MATLRLSPSTGNDAEELHGSDRAFAAGEEHKDEDEEELDPSSRRLSALHLPMLSLSSLPSEATEDSLMLDTTTAGEELEAREAQLAEEREDDRENEEEEEAMEKEREAEDCVDDRKATGTLAEGKRDDSSERGDELFEDKSIAQETGCEEDTAPQPKLQLQKQVDGEEKEEDKTIEISPRSSEDLTVECASPRDVTSLDTDHENPDIVGTGGDDAAVVLLPTSPEVEAGIKVEVESKPTSQDLSAVRPATYTVKSLFPVVYDAEPSADVEVAEQPPSATNTTPATAPAPPQASMPRSSRKPQKAQRDSVASRLAQLQQSNDRLTTELQTASRASKLQLQLVERERHVLSQRVTRLQSQLTTLTTELTRCKAENAKLTTENELYAAKLPQLSTALSQETTQLDERNAQSVASQLELSSLRARAQVLQTRNHRLEAELQALQQTARQLKSDARRKALAAQQADEKLRKLESELNEARSHAADERHQWKRRLQELTQRADRERRQRELEHERESERRLNDAKAALHKAQRDRKDADATLATLRQELEHCKQQLEQRDIDARRRNREFRAAEATIRQNEKREATLRSHLHRAKLQLRVLERQQKQHDVRAGSWSVAVSAAPSSKRKAVEEEQEEDDNDTSSSVREEDEEEKRTKERTSRIMRRTRSTASSREAVSAVLRFTSPLKTPRRRSFGCGNSTRASSSCRRQRTNARCKR
ncbi:hypothetical protein PINS_up010264 [Pythium insidiosum]|nr:hypothetical protein PINS_up010264 [Pythium insidiosum]